MALLPEEFAGSGILLRRWAVGDEVAVWAAIEESYHELHRWLDWADESLCAATLHERVTRARQEFDGDVRWEYFVFDDTSGAFLGAGALHRRGARTLEVGYWTRTSARGQGVAAATAAAITDAGFRFVPSAGTVVIRMDQANAASAAVPPKIGFHLEREESRPVRAPGHTGRGYVWSIDRAEWSSANGLAAVRE